MPIILRTIMLLAIKYTPNVLFCGILAKYWFLLFYCVIVRMLYTLPYDLQYDSNNLKIVYFKQKHDCPNTSVISPMQIFQTFILEILSICNLYNKRAPLFMIQTRNVILSSREKREDCLKWNNEEIWLLKLCNIKVRYT